MKHQALFQLQFGWRFHGDNQKTLEIVRTTLIDPDRWELVDGEIWINNFGRPNHGRPCTPAELQCLKLVEWEDGTEPV